MAIVKFTSTKLQSLNKKGVLKPDSDGYYTLVIGGLNVYNSVGEYYMLEGARQLFEESSILMRRVQNGNLKGELGHPKREPGQSLDAYMDRLLQVYETNVCVHFKDLWLDTEYGQSNSTNRSAVAIYAKIKPAGPHASTLQAALENKHENVNFSVRGLTEDFVQNGKTCRVLKQIICWDYVTECGINIANKYDSPTLESLNETPVLVRQLEALLTRTNPITLESKTLIQDTLASLHKPTAPPAYYGWN